MLFRPRAISEWIWALGGAALLAVLGLVPLPDVGRAVGRGIDVYFFLAGMMVLAEIARHEGVFDWIAGLAVVTARGSRRRLFALVYVVGIVVTTVLSNDATAVVLTPAVAAAVRKARAAPLPHLYACAFIANAASFVLPISNPANLVVFAQHMPTLIAWLRVFALPSLAAIAVTFGMLAFVSRADLRGDVATDIDVAHLTSGARIALGGIALTAIALIVASAVGAQLGLVTSIAGVLVYVVMVLRDRSGAVEVVQSISWTVLLLVAGLFVLVEGMERTGLLELTRAAARTVTAWPLPLSVLGGGGIVGLATNAINNLPAGLIAGATVATVPGHDAFRSAVAIGIDLGPNLSVTGSLATVLWLIALRREKIEVSAIAFLRVGLVVMPPALVLAVESLVFVAR